MRQSLLSRWQLGRVARSLSSGGVIAYPTESVFGLGCDPQNLAAVARILDIKQRPARKGLILLVSDFSQALAFIEPLSESQQKQLLQPQSRATTWLLPKRADLSPLICGDHAKVAIRITNHPIARSICQISGSALVSTSCNRAGKPAMHSSSQVRNHFYQQLDLIVNGWCDGQPPSQIIDLLSRRVVRA